MSVDDDATDREMRDREMAIERQRRLVAPPPLTPSDECLNECGTPPRERSNYCSVDCRDDHAARIAQRQRSGQK